MTTTAIDADGPLTEGQRQKVAEFEAAMPPHMRAELGLRRTWERLALLADFTQPTLARLDAIQTKLMGRRFRERDRSILVPAVDDTGQPIHPLIDPWTGRPVPLVGSTEELVKVWFWAARIDQVELERKLSIAGGVVALVRWLRDLARRMMTQVLRALCDAFYFGDES